MIEIPTSLPLFLVCLVSVYCQSFHVESLKKNLTAMTVTEKIKQQILEKLGMKSRPTVCPEGVDKTDYVIYIRQNVTDRTRKVNEIISFSEPPDKFNDDRVIQFRFAKDIQGRRMIVKSASLLIKVKSKHRKRRKYSPKSKSLDSKASRKRLRKANKRRRGRKVSLSISTVTSSGLPGEAIAAVESRIKANKWFKVSLRKTAVQDLVDSSNGTVLLYVKCVGCKKNTHVVLVHSRRRKKRQLRTSLSKKKKKARKLNKGRPFLILHTFIETPDRRKRSVSSSECWSGSERCCKRNVYMNFTEIGWNDWIISPPGFRTAECFGGCRPRDSNTTSCSPTRRRSLRLIYQNSPGVYISSFLTDFIVLNCGCSSQALREAQPRVLHEPR